MQPLLEKALESEIRLLDDAEIATVTGASDVPWVEHTHDVWFCDDPEGGYRVWKEAEMWD